MVSSRETYIIDWIGVHRLNESELIEANTKSHALSIFYQNYKIYDRLDKGVTVKESKSKYPLNFDEADMKFLADREIKLDTLRRADYIQVNSITLFGDSEP